MLKKKKKEYGMLKLHKILKRQAKQPKPLRHHHITWGPHSVTGQGLPWWSRSQESEFPMQGARVQSLVRELRSYKPHGTVNK